MLLMIARSSLALYTQASSLLSNPTRTLSSRILGSLDNMSLRTPGPTLAPHPPAAVISVSLTSSSAIGMAQQDFFSLSPIILFLFLLLNLVKSYYDKNHNALKYLYVARQRKFLDCLKSCINFILGVEWSNRESNRSFWKRM